MAQGVYVCAACESVRVCGTPEWVCELLRMCYLWVSECESASLRSPGNERICSRSWRYSHLCMPLDTAAQQWASHLPTSHTLPRLQGHRLHQRMLRLWERERERTEHEQKCICAWVAWMRSCLQYKSTKLQKKAKTGANKGIACQR